MKLLLFIILLCPLSLSAQEEAEESEALRALRLSCEKQRVGLGCFNYANLLLRTQTGDADKYFEQGCILGHQPSCQKEKWELPERVTTANEEPTAATYGPASTDPVEEAPAEGETLDPTAVEPTE